MKTMATKKAPETMTSPEETERALRALRFTETRHGDRLSDHEVANYLKFTRELTDKIEQLIRDNRLPEMNGNREQILAVLRPHVRWLDANPAKDPQIKDARALPTSVLAEVLRERKEAERKARRKARSDHYKQGEPFTDEDRAAICAAWERVKGVPFKDTPGRKATYPRLSQDKTRVVDVPVVVLEKHPRGHITRLDEKYSTILPANWPLDFVDDATWNKALADLKPATEAAS